MKKSITAFASCFLISCCLLFVSQQIKGTAQAQIVSEVGRFQIVQGTYTINVKGQGVTETNVFKIDTRTGSTWIYREGQQRDGKLFAGWEKVPD
jgi:hypothetical protein